MSKSGSVGLFFDDKLMVIFPYSSPVLPSEQSYAQAIVDGLKCSWDLIFTKLQIDDPNAQIDGLKQY